MLELFDLKPKTFGLDISDLSLKIAKLEKTGEGLELVSFGESPIKFGLLKEGEIRKEKELAKTIKEALSQVTGEKIKERDVIASLPEEKAFLQVIQMPHIPKEDMASAVIYEAENYIPLPIEEVYLDSQIISPIENHLDHCDVLIAALPKKIVDPYISCLKLAGLRPRALEIESLSIARALIENETTDCPVLLIDLGATRTSFIIYSGRSVRFTASIPVSSHKFTEAISQTLKVDLEKAEQLKIEHGLKVGTAEGKEIFEALIPSITDLTEQIQKYLGFYQTHASHEHLPLKNRGLNKILLCGGGSNLEGLSDFLSSELKMTVEFGNPWINILPKNQKRISKLPLAKSLSFTSALGLALRGVKEND